MVNYFKRVFLFILILHRTLIPPFHSVDEFRQVVKKLEGEKLSDADVERIVKEADIDGDGEVNYEGKY